jgi:uncharacterized protein YjbJ (UPF0337 family)
MAEKEELKGRAKEAAGAATGDEDLKRQGKKDQATSKAKQKVREAEEKVEELIDRARDKR